MGDEGEGVDLVRVSCGGDTWRWDDDIKVLSLDYACSGEVDTECYGGDAAPTALREEAQGLIGAAVALEELAQYIETGVMPGAPTENVVAVYEAWKRDPSTARPYEEFRAEMGLT